MKKIRRRKWKIKRVKGVEVVDRRRGEDGSRLKKRGSGMMKRRMWKVVEEE